MAEAKKPVARIPVPFRKAVLPEPSAENRGEMVNPEPPADGALGVHRLMSRAAPAKRDTLVVPLAGLVLAFSVVSLIVQLLIAFS
jgi:hypothetical protein